MIKGSIMINFRINQDLLDRLNSGMVRNNLGSTSNAIRYYLELGLTAESFKAEITNPDFLKSIDELKQGDAVFQWVDSLSENQKDAIFYALKMNRELRYEQAKLR